MNVIKKVKKEEKVIVKNNRKCIVCGETAEYCMRGIPTSTYCRDCAEEYFKFLNYLDKL